MILTKLICLRSVLLVTLTTAVAGNGLITTMQGQAGSVRDKFVGTWC
jgi:hypothetical protein